MTAQKLVSDRIAMLRYLMIVGVVILHTPPYVPITEIGPGIFDFIKAFFQNAAFRATVPVLTLISGYLLFRSGLDQDWRRLFNKKARTIVLPFFVFNLLVLASALAAQHLLGLRMSYQLLPFDTQTWLDAAFGISASPINYPLNFLRDLIVLMVFAPLHACHPDPQARRSLDAGFAWMGYAKRQCKRATLLGGPFHVLVPLTGIELVTFALRMRSSVYIDVLISISEIWKYYKIQ
ncbi:acyltransferase family protein [Massilia alkalitolerans]|uniref:acyltransferase family protein n=1 Tax=Massilia alkalitolerans TaxID=286638 RepID=UPI0028AF4F6F|nr:acyltransferase family protein [Massilia alkalitolerans]